MKQRQVKKVLKKMGVKDPTPQEAFDIVLKECERKSPGSTICLFIDASTTYPNIAVRDVTKILMVSSLTREELDKIGKGKTI